MIRKKNSHRIWHFLFFDTSKWHMICWCLMGSSPFNGSASSALQDKYQQMGMMRGRVRKWQRIFILDRGPQCAIKTAEQHPVRGLNRHRYRIYPHSSTFCCKIQHFHWFVIRPIIWTKLAQILYNTFHKFQMKSLFTKWMWFSIDATLSS